MVQIAEEGRTNIPTCHARVSAAETRRDYILTNHQGLDLITAHKVKPAGVFPTHRVFKVRLQMDVRNIDAPKQYLTPTNASNLFDAEVIKQASVCCEGEEPRF